MEHPMIEHASGTKFLFLMANICFVCFLKLSALTLSLPKSHEQFSLLSAIQFL